MTEEKFTVEILKRQQKNYIMGIDHCIKLVSLCSTISGAVKELRSFKNKTRKIKID